MSEIWPKKQVPKWWLPLLASCCSAAVVLAVLVLAEMTGPHPPSGRDRPVEPLGTESGTVHLAGTGTWLSLAKTLALAYESAHPAKKVVVHQSIGSRGGRQAVMDGIIDIGLASARAGHARELECCETVEVARAAVVFATHPSVDLDRLSKSQVFDIYNKNTTSWPSGHTIVPLLREQGDSATRVAAEAIPGLGEAIERALHAGRWPTLITDAGMALALRATPGSIGICDFGSIRLEYGELRPLAFDGVIPSVETLEDGTYPLTRTLVMYVPTQSRSDVRAFVQFVQSPAGQVIIRDTGGYLPLTQDEGGKS